MTTLNQIQDFFKANVYAIAGVSTVKHKFGNAICKEFKTNNLKYYQIHHSGEMLNDENTYKNLKDLPEKPESLIVCIKPEKTPELIKEAIEIGIKNIWFQQGSANKEAVKLAMENKINVIENKCIMMFLNPVKGPHKFHRAIIKFFGKYPKTNNLKLAV